MIGLLICQKNVWLFGAALNPKGLRSASGMTTMHLEEEGIAITIGRIINLVLIKVNVSNGNWSNISIRRRRFVRKTVGNPLKSANRRQTCQVSDIAILNHLCGLRGLKL